MPALEWVCTLGGPLLLIPAELAPRWRGNEAPLDPLEARKLAPRWTLAEVPTDYDRAGENLDDVHAEEYESCGSIAVIGGGRALLLDLESSSTGVSWRDGAVLLRGVELETQEQAVGFLESIASWTPTRLSLELGAGGLLAFDAAFPGNQDPSKIEAEYGVLQLALQPGRYTVSCAVLPDRIYLLRFSPSAPG